MTRKAARSPIELRYCALSRLVLLASAWPRFVAPALRVAFRLEGGHLLSGSARQILDRRLGVSIGAYSYGACFTPGQFQGNTVVGRYVSVAPGVRTHVRNHPTQTLSTHPYFFNSGLGLVPQDTVPLGRLVIEHDVWLGANVVVTPGCRRIGIGAVVAAGTVVTRDVADFAVVAGVPGRVLRFRFPEELQAEILRSRWWELSPDQLSEFLPQLTTALPTDEASYRPLLERLSSVAQAGRGDTAQGTTPRSRD